MEPRTVTRIAFADTPRNELPGGSWSKLLITSESVSGNAASLGYSTFPAGAVTNPVVHETEEFVFVAEGAGELRVDGGSVPFQKHDALHIPAGVWHAVANTGDEPVTMVFGFPTPDYPPTRRRESS